MSSPDLNLLIALDALLADGSVAHAARRLHLSQSAMSRTLARLRQATGDPLLVRAGRRLVPTPRATELRDQASRLVQEAQAVLRPASRPQLQHLERTFTLRNSDGFVENFGPTILARVFKEAPGVTLRFMQKPHKDNSPLRDGTADLETGVIEEATAPEFRVQALFRDHFIGVIRTKHPLARGKITAERYAAAAHVGVSRHGRDRGVIDDALAQRRLERRRVAIVGGFAAALALARSTDLVATVPDKHTRNLAAGCRRFALPFATPPLTISMIWHPRLDADPAHQWLRGIVRDICREDAARS